MYILVVKFKLLFVFKTIVQNKMHLLISKKIFCTQSAHRAPQGCEVKTFNTSWALGGERSQSPSIKLYGNAVARRRNFAETPQLPSGRRDIFTSKQFLKVVHFQKLYNAVRMHLGVTFLSVRWRFVWQRDASYSRNKKNHTELCVFGFLWVHIRIHMWSCASATVSCVRVTLRQHDGVLFKTVLLRGR